MKFILGLAQCKHPEDGDVIKLVDQIAAQAKSSGVNLLVFPECLMTPFEKTLEDFMKAAQPVDGPFVKSVNSIAKKYGIWISYTFNEQGPDGKAPYNVNVISDDNGVTQWTYRKTHLFDTDFIKESDRITAGESLPEPLQTPFGSIYAGICYDLRFPELARIAAMQGCSLMLYPAAWFDGELKAEQWKTMLQSRAIENEIFVAGLCRADDKYVGQSYVFGPRGELIASNQQREDLIFATIDLDEIDKARKSMPILMHRRPDLYQQLSE